MTLHAARTACARIDLYEADIDADPYDNAFASVVYAVETGGGSGVD